MNLWPFSRATDESDTPPPPEQASFADVDEYHDRVAKRHGVSVSGGRDGDRPAGAADEQQWFAKASETEGTGKRKAEFPWLFDPSRGVSWDFDPIELRNDAQENAWVQMLIQSIAKEIAEAPLTITEGERTETHKRLSTHPEERSPIEKELPDATAERIYDLLHDPNPDDNWHDMVEMWISDLLEIGSLSAVKAFPKSAYDGDEFIADPGTVEPVAIQTSAPEVWTKDYHEKTGIINGYWQFDNNFNPGGSANSYSRSGTRGISQPTFFDTPEMVWSDMSPRSNRRYGMAPTLLVHDFLESLDLALEQEQQYLSRGSIPSGAWVFEEYNRKELKNMKEVMEKNVKGKPHKSLTLAGKGGNVKFEPMSMNFQELEFTERMQWYSKVISAAFQVPTAVVGLAPEKINYNTFQGERENFENNTLGPYLQQIERIINGQIIQPHWGHDYRAEFKPGMSESTRAMKSERARQEFSAGLIRRNEARQELGREDVDEEFDGFQDEVVEDTSPEDAIDDLALSKAEYEVGDETLDITPPDYMVAAAEAGQEARGEYDGLDDCGTGVGNERARQIIDDEVGPDTVGEIAAYLTSHEEDVASLDGNYTDWDEAEWTDGCGTVQYALWGGTGDGRALEWAQETANEVAEARGEELPYAASAGDAGNLNGEGVAKDDDLRNTDEWYQFDVQPEMIEELQDALNDDIQSLYDAVLDDEAIADEIERLAVEDDDTAEKSEASLARRLRDLLSSLDVADRIADAIRSQTTDAMSDAVRDTQADVDEAANVDVEAIRSRLRDRDIGFANRFADEMAEDIRETIADGWADEKGSEEIRNEIAEQADIKSGWTGAERIARQELQIATGEARSAVAEDIGKVEVWETAGDDRVRDPHAQMQGTWKAPGEEWEVDYSAVGRGVQTEGVPGDSKPGIGCRCVTLLRDRDEVDDEDHAGV